MSGKASSIDDDAVLVNQSGNLSVSLGGLELELRPTYPAFLAIERQCQCGLVELSQRMANQQFALSDVVTILHAASQAAGQDYDEERIGTAVVKAGLWPDAASAAIDVLSVGLAGFRTLDAPSTENNRKRRRAAASKKAGKR